MEKHAIPRGGQTRTTNVDICGSSSPKTSWGSSPFRNILARNEINRRDEGMNLPMLYWLRSFWHSASVNAVLPEPTGLPISSETENKPLIRAVVPSYPDSEAPLLEVAGGIVGHVALGEFPCDRNGSAIVLRLSENAVRR